MFDSHVHSFFSEDSEMPLYKACDKAINLGLNGLAFTDHVDYDFPEFDESFMIDFAEYSSVMDELKQKYADKLKVLKGLEIGLQTHVLPQCEQLVRSFDFDFVIGSIHIIDRQNPYIDPYYKDKSMHEAYSRYLQVIFENLSLYDDYDVMGHIDYIIRKGSYPDRSLLYKDHKELIDSILKLLVSKGKGMEVNTSSFRNIPGIATPSYDIMILKRFKELGGEIITLGSDAHQPEYIGHKFELFTGMIAEAGFKYVAHFENRKPVFEKIVK